jgi:ribosomal-protein-alanine N-acetyltransferase
MEPVQSRPPDQVAPLRTLLTTARLILRPLEEADRAGFLAMERESRDFFGAYAPGRDGLSDDEFFDRQLARSRDGLASGTALRRAGFLRDDGTLVGIFNVSDIVRGVSLRCNMGWRVHHRFARQGLASEAVGALLDHAFTAESAGGLGLHRCECAIQPGNTPSLRLAAKLGFRIEGYALRYLRIGDGWKDHYLLAKLAEEHGQSVR